MKMCVCVYAYMQDDRRTCGKGTCGTVGKNGSQRGALERKERKRVRGTNSLGKEEFRTGQNMKKKKKK